MSRDIRGDGRLDSREVEYRIHELEEMLDCDGMTEEEQIELSDLRDFRSEAEPYCPDWHHGVTFIREDEFEEYAKELLSDIGDIPENLPGYIVIDWEGTSDNIAMDYSEAELDGITYLFRAS